MYQSRNVIKLHKTQSCIFYQKNFSEKLIMIYHKTIKHGFYFLSKSKLHHIFIMLKKLTVQ